MTSEEPQQTVSDTETTEPTPALPDYLASPNAVFKDEGVQWRYGRAPDYTKTRKVWAEGKRMDHAAGSLPQLVENLVKNWEVEASFKPRLSDWRTVDHEKYSFAMGGGKPQNAEHMIKVGTYNGIIGPNEYYSPENSDFNSSHKTFKRMMPTFAWEVLEVYSGPPRVAFRWRHWGVMKSDYVGFNNKGEKVTAKAHGGLIDIEGVTVAEVDDKIRLQAIQTWMDPLEMFRQIAPEGVVRKETMNREVNPDAALDIGPVAGAEAVREHDSQPGPHVDNASSIAKESDGPISGQTAAGVDRMPDVKIAGESTSEADAIVSAAAVHPDQMVIEKPESNAKEVTQTLEPTGIPSSDVLSDNVEKLAEGASRTIDTAQYFNGLPASARNEHNSARDQIDDYLEKPAENIHPSHHEVVPAGEALAAPANSYETRIAHEEMSQMSAGECPFLQNRE